MSRMEIDDQPSSCRGGTENPKEFAEPYDDYYGFHFPAKNVYQQVPTRRLEMSRMEIDDQPSSCRGGTENPKEFAEPYDDYYGFHFPAKNVYQCVPERTRSIISERYWSENCLQEHVLRSQSQCLNALSAGTITE
jgi:hypothetical protein